LDFALCLPYIFSQGICHLIEKQPHNGKGLILCIAGWVFNGFDQLKFIHGESSKVNIDHRL
jgi:hypothetical protein